MRRVRVVVADDRPPFRRAARAVLEAMPDFELVAEVDSGEAAIEAVSTFRPELVLMDVQMEGIGGLEATRRISHADPRPAVIVVSSDRIEGIAAAALEAGALAFLPKDQLSATVLRELWSSPARSPAPTGRRAPPSPGG